MAEDSSQMLKKYRELLQKSPTAYSPGTTPTSKDIFLQRQEFKAKKAEEMSEAQKLKEQWYTERDVGEPKDEKGAIGRILHAMLTPGYAVTGAIESALGKGTEKGLVKNIKANIKEEGTMGDLLRSYGMNNYAAMPLGLALDIAVDPIAWLTLGTSAIVPRTVLGATRAAKTGESALKGARLGVESSLLGKAAWTGKAVSTVGKKFGVTRESRGLGRFADLQKTISERAAKTSTQYEKITGESLEKIIKHSQRDRIFDKISRKLEKTNFGKNIKTLFELSSGKHFRRSLKLEDEAREAAAVAGKNIGKSIDDVDDILFRKGEMTAKGIETRLTSLEVASKMKAEKAAADKLAEQIAGEIDNIKHLLDGDITSLKKLSGMKDSELKDIAELVRHYKIDIKGYDKNVAKILTGEKARKFFSAYAVYTGWFKNMKIGGNVATWANALVGNIAMTSMAGINITSSGFSKSMKAATSMMVSKDTKYLKPFLESKSWSRIIKKYPETFEAVFGINAKTILQGRRFIDNKIDDLMKSGKFKSSDFNAIKNAHNEAYKTYTRRFEVSPGLRATVRTAAGVPEGTFFSAEFMTGPYAKFLEKIKKMGDSGNKAAALTYRAATSSMEGYNKIDQTYRVGNALNLTREGITNKELKLLANRFTLGLSDVTKVGEKYKLSPLKAMEISQEIYMNYAAMPGFVKAMRTLPLAGFPFVSFAYGMTALSAKTLAYNPMFYNKVSYLLHEISGQKSPLEKQALESGYYQWMQKPGMMKVPFFQENPVYLNLANMIPHYTMNILQPSERNFESRFGGQVANMLDKLPFFKTPDGQVMMDYVLLPMILQGERPQGMFGQPLWEKDAGLLKRIGYGARALGESVTPPLAGYLGLGTVAGMPPEEALPAIPLYRLRQLGYATKGKSSLGIPGKEPAMERTARVMAAMSGVPYYPVKLQYQTPRKK